LDVPPRALAQLAASPATISTSTSTSTFSATPAAASLALAPDHLVDIPLAAHAPLLDERARRALRGPKPGREDVPARGARGHLEAHVARAIDELEHRVRRVVARAPAKLVYARVAARALRVARRERLEELGRERGLQQQGGRFLPGWVRAALS
jgi:hypothetical protein